MHAIVHKYGSNVPKERRERYAKEEFCNAMSRLYGGRYSVVEDSLERGIVKTVGGSTVDGVLKTPNGMVAVELVTYSPNGVRGGLLTADLRLREFLGHELGSFLTSHRCSLQLGYSLDELQTAKRRTGANRVPYDNQFSTLASELESAVQIALPLTSERFISLYFLNDDLAARMGRRVDRWHLPASRYPLCSSFFDRLRLQRCSEGLKARIDSNMNSGHVSLDIPWTREYVLKKAKLSLQHSLIRANGLPLWLLVHSDGHALHQTIPEPHRRVAVTVCRECLSVIDHRFARAYWADRTAFANAAWASRIL